MAVLDSALLLVASIGQNYGKRRAVHGFEGEK